MNYYFRKAFAAVLLGVLLVLTGYGSGRYAQNLQLFAAEKEFLFSLTAEEEAYLQSLRGETLTLAVAEQSAYQQDVTGKLPYGMAVPLLEFLEYELSLEVEVYAGTWQECREALSSGEADLLFGVPVLSKELASFEVEGQAGWCSAPFYEEQMYLVTRKGIDAMQLYREPESRLGIVEAALWSEQLQPWLVSDWEQIPFEDTEAMLSALLRGEILAAALPESELFLLFAEEAYTVTEPLLPHTTGIAVGAIAPELESLMKLIDRYMAQTEEGDALQEAVADAKIRLWTQAFQTQNQELLAYVRERYATLTYASMSRGSVPMFWKRDGATYGLLPELMNVWAELSGIPAEYVDRLDDEEALSLLEEEELLVLAGLTQSGEEREDICFSKALGMGSLVAVLSETETKRMEEALRTGSSVKEEIAYCYWGTQEDIFPLLSGTVFDGHAVVFGSEAALFDAFSEGTVGGMLIREGVYEQQWNEMQRLEEIAYVIPERLAFCASGEELNLLFEKLLYCYEITHPQAWERWQAAGKVELLAQTQASAGKQIRLLQRGLICGAAGVAALLLGLLWAAGSKKEQKVKEKT